MSEILRYVLVNEQDVEGDWEYSTFDEAKSDAQKTGHLAVIQRTYTYDDSELVWAPNNADTWPHESKAR
jgi:hypothetical protein